MKIYDYKQHVAEDIAEYLEDNYPELNKDSIKNIVFNDFYDEFYDKLFITDSVTGNGSGSYTFNTIEAEQNLVGNWELLTDATEELDPDFNPLKQGAEACDVLIRIYLLPDALQCVYNNFKQK